MGNLTGDLGQWQGFIRIVEYGGRVYAQCQRGMRHIASGRVTDVKQNMIPRNLAGFMRAQSLKVGDSAYVILTRSSERHSTLWVSTPRNGEEAPPQDDTPDDAPAPQETPEDAGESNDLPNSRVMTMLDRILFTRVDGFPLSARLVGPAGCGKSTLVRLWAERHGLTFDSIEFARDDPPRKIKGYRDLSEHGTEYKPTALVNIAENGGVCLLDEWDNLDGNTQLVVNPLIANGYMNLEERYENPTLRRHPDSYFVAACNTFGRGADRMYVGREEMDLSQRDRFIVITVDYDADYENGVLSAVPNASHRTVITSLRDSVRKAIDNSKGSIRQVYSTRMLKAHCALITAGMTLSDITASYFADWSRNERETAVAQGCHSARVAA